MKNNDENKPMFRMTLRSRQKKVIVENEKEKDNENKSNVKIKNKKNKSIGRHKKVKKENSDNENDYENESENNSNDIESDYEYNKENNDDDDSDTDSSFETTVKNQKGKSSRKRIRIKKEYDNKNNKIKKEEKMYKINRNEFSEEVPQTVIKIREKLIQEIIPEKKGILMNYFKTGPGEYAEGDQFFGIPVPGIRSTVKFCHNLDFENLLWLITSSYHEERMLAAVYMSELSKKLIKEEENKKRKSDKNSESYHFILDSINDSLNKYKCHTIPDLIHCLFNKKGWTPGERKGWDVIDIEASKRRQEQKFKRIGESRPIFLDQNLNDNNNNDNKEYQYHSNIGITDPIKIQKQILFEYYVECMPWIDNWDLVDLTCREIIGGFLIELDHKQIKNILYSWLTYNINDQLSGYNKLKIKKEENKIIKEENEFLNPLEDDISLTTIWTKRVAIICTFYFIVQSDFRYTIYILETLLDYENEIIHGPIIPQCLNNSYNYNNNNNNNKKRFHDLIEKASGWMLREIGKRDSSCSGKGCKCILKDSNEKNVKKNSSSVFNLYGNEKKTLIHFLNKYAWKMPRTMLRYSIEKLPASSKSIYLNATTPLEVNYT